MARRPGRRWAGGAEVEVREASLGRDLDVELLDAMLAREFDAPRGIADVHVALLIDQHAGRECQVARLAPCRSPATEVAAALIEHQHGRCAAPHRALAGKEPALRIRERIPR